MSTLTILTAAQRSAAEVEHFAAQMADFPGDERALAIERIRIVVDRYACDDVDRLREIRNVLAGLDLAIQRRRQAVR